MQAGAPVGIGAAFRLTAMLFFRGVSIDQGLRFIDLGAGLPQVHPHALHSQAEVRQVVVEIVLQQVQIEDVSFVRPALGMHLDGPVVSLYRHLKLVIGF